MRKIFFGVVAGALAGASMSLAAQAESLTMAVATGPSSMDPHYHNLTPNNMIARHVFETLVDQDDKQRLIPGLATSWKPIDDTTWEFKLREGVTWHDGSPFTADDVAFTLERAPNVPNSPSSFGTYLKNIDKVEVVDPTTVRLHTRTVAPLTPTDVSQVYMVSRKNGEGATTEDYNTGKAMIGTGPYRFKEWVPGDRIVYTRNDDYWGEKEPWDEVVIQPISNNAARVAALLSGDVDMIDNVPTNDIERLKGDDALALSQGVSNRIIYLHMDQFRDKSPFVRTKDGAPMDENPLLKPEVRKALSKAINRDAIVERVMSGVALPAGQLLPEGFFGVSPNLKPEPYDPEGAKQMLADAGYPDGFAVTIHGPNDRYINDAKIVQAIAQMWTRLGIPTEVDTMTKGVFFSRASSGADGLPEFSVVLVGWGAGTGEASSPLRSLLMTYDKDKGWGASNRGRHSNAKVDEITADALGTVDDAKREALLREATEVAIGESQGIIPLHYQVNTWATRKGLGYRPRTDEYTFAMGVRKSGS